jgi:hypothetical protein
VLAYSGVIRERWPKRASDTCSFFSLMRQLGVVAVIALALVGCGGETHYTALQVHRALKSEHLQTQVFDITPTVTTFFNGRERAKVGLRNLFRGTHLRALVLGPQSPNNAMQFTVSAIVFDSREAAQQQIGAEAHAGNGGIAVRSITHRTAQQRANVVIVSDDQYATAVHQALRSLP